ncbi:DUF3046 domain-containing protein [Actinomyces sp. HMT897]|uniref:DUF3046 domain-containing protein n=1 Tax=Actinomyces sp. HMT897 TaxID=2789424 RepID=UPI00190D861D|nr:DUF3046 domain-containing protein [Actinomyces sp. HMT897]QQO77675.1 DUF3046 domain-containing protein [Actinomyces sp. HMT897]
MRHSEFWRSVETVFGPAYGRSLVQDLVVPALGATCAAALEAGTSPGLVWSALCDEMQVTQAQRWVFRVDPRDRGHRGHRGR